MAFFSKGAQEREKREKTEDQQRPRAHRHRRPGLEHDPISIRLKQHVPKAQRSPEIEDEQDRADDDARQRDVISQARQAAVFGAAKQIDQDADKIASTRQATEEKVPHDIPSPLRRGAKKSTGRKRIHGRCSSLVRAPRLRKLMIPIRPTMTAPSIENHEAEARLCVGIFGSGGKPYTSGLSTNR